jgi:hypothetical protein
MPRKGWSLVRLMTGRDLYRFSDRSTPTATLLSNVSERLQVQQKNDRTERNSAEKQQRKRRVNWEVYGQGCMTRRNEGVLNEQHL